jgi:hypothetical protein
MRVDGSGRNVRAAGTESAWRRFWSDTAVSARVWRSQPALPLLTLVVWLPISGLWGYPYFWTHLPFAAFALGFLGMQREWYANAFAGMRPSPRRIWSRSWRYFVRFLPIAIASSAAWIGLVGVVIVPLLVRSSSDFASFRLRIEIAFALWSFVVDLVLTFVMPALVFATANPFKATVIGMRYLRRSWSAVKWHALVPPMAIIVIGQIIRGGHTAVAYGVTITLIGAMLNLLFKGAQLRAYLGHADELGVTVDNQALVATS